jgi:hypothetical protein
MGTASGVHEGANFVPRIAVTEARIPGGVDNP